jgi:hypothetical protein
MVDDAALAGTIEGLERRLLDPGVRATADRLAPLLADDFLEFGKSGRVFLKADTLLRLPEEKDDWSYKLSDFTIRRLAENVVLATYRIVTSGKESAESRSLRSSIWKREADGQWRLTFHQGTGTT